jgi:hypothetical protein
MRKLAGLIAAVAVAVSLSGCTSIPGVSSQTGPQACAAVSNEMTTALKNFQDAIGTAATDPDAAATAIDKLVTDFKASRGKVTNAGVGAAMDKVVAALDKMSQALKDGGAGMSSDEFTTASEDVQTGFTELSTACTKI